MCLFPLRSLGGGAGLSFGRRLIPGRDQMEEILSHLCKHTCSCHLDDRCPSAPGCLSFSNAHSCWLSLSFHLHEPRYSVTWGLPALSLY